MHKQLPVNFLDSISNAKGFELQGFVKTHAEAEAITTIRFNPFKKIAHRDAAFQMLEKVPWCSNGYYLKERPSFTLDPFFHAGAYYVQEASSMFLEEVLQQSCHLSQQLKVLDLCAAPGGKSTLIQSLISKSSFLVSNEVIKSRVNILTENVTKWGASNIVVTHNDPKDFKQLPDFFDVVVVDAPCSGSGLFRKDPLAIEEWSVENVALCSQRQQRILSDILVALKPGGVLIYSTCSYSMEENEIICDWLLNDSQLESIQIKLPSTQIIETCSSKKGGYGYRFYPNKIKGEGFFIAAFRKNDNADNLVIPKVKNKNEGLPTKQKTVLEPWIENFNHLEFINWQDQIIALSPILFQYLPVLQSSLYIKKAGVNIGSIIRDELIPSHDLAMSHFVGKNIHRLSLEKNVALQYLRRQPIDVDLSQKGWSLVTYHDLPLGFIKILSNRINNYYPQEWRIFNM